MSVLHFIRSVFRTFRAAGNAASAVEMHRIPSVRDLKTLGIDRAAFKQMQL
ncbi:hypothetical protein RGQ15_06705 [Paracoccus sp. MBLB3053]|uniref:DUF1127 domain-containing protein n=1 Tax=Paracoccus aurantius TaxID=3073814 RepID=A0ABU2HQG0_9RHOB|nr:hypothetical protein [Paracoccus sp. MBLB3053]MDS9467263.1 hypothetical protein [Paracoccus sp. MBLB3053]